MKNILIIVIIIIIIILLLDNSNGNPDGNPSGTNISTFIPNLGGCGITPVHNGILLGEYGLGPGVGSFGVGYALTPTGYGTIPSVVYNGPGTTPVGPAIAPGYNGIKTYPSTFNYLKQPIHYYNSQDNRFSGNNNSSNRRYPNIRVYNRQPLRIRNGMQY